MAVLQRVADYQITAMAAGLNPIKTGESYPNPRGWVQAALLVGMTELADRSADPRYRQFILQRGEANQWKLAARKYFADDQAIAQAYLWAARNGAGAIAASEVKAEFDAILEKPSMVALEFTEHRAGTGFEALGCQSRWCWSDALFMAPAIWFELSNQTGDARYAAFAKKEFWATTDYLFDNSENLYFRDSRFFTRRDAAGRKLFWSRGVGWAFAGLARIIDRLPERDADRARMVALFQRMAQRLKALQKDDGYWAPSLLANGPDTPPESSGTGFFTYGLAWGVQRGVLDRGAYEASARKGWAALLRAVHADGKLGHVQPVSDRPDDVSRDDTQLYGVGAFLLAGTAMADLASTTPATGPHALRPPTAEERVPRAVARHAPDRADDLIWENDKVAHRIYGPALQKAEPPSGSGIDAWAKKVRWPFMDRQLKTPNYHDDHGEGLDFYGVGGSRGVGGLGIWFDDKLWVSRNWASHQILQSGSDVASFQVSYAPWPVGVDRRVWETRRFTLLLGSHLTRLQSLIESDRPGDLIVGIGLNKTPVGTARGTLTVDAKRGLLMFWTPAHARHGAMGTAVRVEPAMVVDAGADADNHLIRVRVTPGRPFVYYIGSAWEQGLDFKTREAWEAHVAAQRLDFDPK
ncbi:glycoside hydrolase family 88 protein [Roseateles asaccharophilus]|uniref:Rhamnogalacturonyl hydrolase YesR n=1 Tax=Roseateles asaccharophilus TaxID=582607 RepID=A0ABU2A9E0_9BURK|nr:glycoside hydrolase family 88 protein [Roseateles asaccharophilus]MDR7333817.1 rhamnogalacturonyl hydrolase YesR [Roseateles asaccharophilus]